MQSASSPLELSSAAAVASEESREWRACPRCRRARSVCICSRIVPFELDPLLIMLIHPKEDRNTIGTARVVSLSIRNSLSMRSWATRLERDPRITAVLDDPTLFPVVLFPGPTSVNLSRDALPEDWNPIIGGRRRLAIFAIDGSWFFARKMIRTSPRLAALPRVSFDVIRESAYRVRKQPAPLCLSTVEATHRLIEVLHERELARLPENRAHDGMLRVFDWMVDTQLRLQIEGGGRPDRIADRAARAAAADEEAPGT